MVAIIVAKDYDGTLSTLGASSALTLAKTVASVDAQFVKIAKNLGLVAAGLQALKGHQAAMYSMGMLRLLHQGFRIQTLLENLLV